jgi:hypothetical protein
MSQQSFILFKYLCSLHSALFFLCRCLFSQKDDHSALLAALNASLAHTRSELQAVAAAQRHIAQQLAATGASGSGSGTSGSGASGSSGTSGRSASGSVQAQVAAELANERESLRAWVKEQV